MKFYTEFNKEEQRDEFICRHEDKYVGTYLPNLSEKEKYSALINWVNQCIQYAEYSKTSN